LKAEDFSCSLDVLYGGPGISKLQFLIKKINKKIFSLNFSHQNPRSGLDSDPIGIQHKMLDSDSNSKTTDPKHLARIFSKKWQVSGPTVLRIRDVYPDPDFYPSRIQDLGSRILDPKTATKERDEKK
jgi:hypothetical protein